MSSLRTFPSCPRCQRPFRPGSSQCAHCSVAAPPPLGSGPALYTRAPKPPSLPASPRGRQGQAPSRSQRVVRRVLAFVVDVVLGIVTVGVGWLIWAGLVLRRSQTPAGGLFRITLVDSVSGLPLNAWRMILRTAVSFLFGLYVVAGLLWGFGLLIDVGGYSLHSRLIPGLILALIAFDVIALFFPGQRRGIDRLFRITPRASPERFSQGVR